MKADVLTQNSKKGEDRKNHSFYLKSFLLALILFIGQVSNAQIGTWTALKNLEPNENMGVMLLLTDGTVVAHDSVGGSQALGTGWDKLAPDAKGRYVNGTWTTLASMNQERYVFASQVLPNGKLFVAGGEYGVGDTAGEVYDPVANTWTRTEGVVGKMNIYDGNSEILPNGAILVGLQAGNNPSFDCQYYTPSTNKWTTAPTAPLNHDEAAWLKLPDSSILFVGIGSIQSCRFRPQTNTWIADANLPDSIFDIYGYESGSATMLPNGKAIFFGATGHNCIYTPSGTAAKGTWTRAADFPFVSGSETGMVDAPSATMVNGHILMTVSPIGTSAGNNEFLTPTYFMEYDYVSNTFTQVTSILPGIGADSIADIVCQQATLLNLPDGTVLMGINQDGALSKQYFIYTPGSGPIAQGKPTINNVIPDGCSFYKITGKLFNGISEGAGYGDDWQNSTNYPLVRLTDASGDVYYCKTTNWNRIGAVQTDSLEDTAYFALPSVPGGTYSLVVTVNGFASNPVLFTTFGVGIISHTNATCSAANGSATALAADGTAPYTYLWSPSGGTNATASGLSAGIYTITVTGSGGGCSVTASVNILPNPLVLSSLTNTEVTCFEGKNATASVSVIGGTTPYTYSWSGGAGSNAIASGLSAGTYTITVADSCGSSVSSVVSITQPAVIVITTGSGMASSKTSCNGSAIANVKGGTAPYTYLWSPGGETTKNIINQCGGYYCCSVTDNNGCTTSACVDIGITGIENITSNNEKVIISPNPNNGLFSIQSSISGEQSSLVEIYNVLGQKVYSQLATLIAPLSINISNQPNGIYLIRILTVGGSLVAEKKIAKTQ